MYDKKNKKEDRDLSWKDVFYLNQRAVNIWWKRYPQALLSDIVYQIICVLSPYLTIWFSARIIGELAGDRNRDILFSLILALLLSNVLLGILHAICKHWKELSKNMAYEELNHYYNEKMLSMDFAAIDNTHTRDLFAQMQQNQNWSNWGIRRTLSLYGNIVKAVSGIIGAVALSWQLLVLPVPEQAHTLLFMNHPLIHLSIVLLMLSAVLLSPAISNRADSYWSGYAKTATFSNQAFWFFGFLGYEHKRALDIRIYRQDLMCHTGMSANDMFGVDSPIAKIARGTMGKLQGAADAVSRSFIGCVYLFVCLKAWAGAFGVGAVTQYISAVTLLYENITLLLRLVGQIRTNAPFLQDSFTFLDIPNEMYQGSLTVEKRNDSKYEVEFYNVSFRYPGMESYALKNVNLKFRIGTKLAIVGENGSGKTTFIKLLCRLYDPTEGEIRLNGIDIRKYNYAEYMSIFSVVFQDFKLLAFPLGQNVAVGVNYNREAVTESLKKAGMQESLNKMKAGLETYLYKEFEDSGVEISGGEAQKIAIARALNKNAAFLILDEPTAALDAIAEYEIYTKLNEIVGEHTAIYISHRLSSCQFCDEIVVFDRGQVCQQGSHKDLLTDHNGKYYTLYHAQAQYYEKES